MVFLGGICFEGKSFTAYNAAFVAIINHMQERHMSEPHLVFVYLRNLCPALTRH